MAHTWSQKLRVLSTQKGRTIVCNFPADSVKGREVAFKPRFDTDPLPWLIKGEADTGTNYNRFSGRDCKPVEGDHA